ncbi:hypothetical protein D9757_000298 [Collybiopsis confluens]|uniref:THO complex subunit 2 n=1 Tax=Collybiopsis confluens TaxID=2823264 RepID=A0A8H5I285_9AGAR|nr:hypothetical protein D9757_000298 [Collybiopsis confluens]
MDVVNTVQGYLETWKSGGEDECRTMVIAPHCNPSDAGGLNVLTTAYNTLISSTLSLLSQKQTLTADTFVAFLRSVLVNLPSTSSNTTSNVATFGEIFVDLIWAVDAELDEIIGNANAAIAACGPQGADKQQQAVLAKVTKLKQSADDDKATIISIVKKLLELGILNPTVCRERLDSAILDGTGLMIKSVLDKKEVKTRTGLLYKQKKFNLLREQSEGYTKLTVELTSALGIGHIPATARPPESTDCIRRRTRPVWEKIISLIGFFDLDPNKALDIILDVMSANLASHYTFFLALLSFSPWAPSSEENLAAMATDPEPGQFKGKTLDEILDVMDPRARARTSSSNVAQEGSRVLAQILGFKLSYYQSPEAPEPPKALYLTAALLIREGFVALEDLYPHLSPNDSDMGNVRAAYDKDVKSRLSAAKMSQLAMAAPLESTPSSSLASSKAKPAPASDTKKPPECSDLPNQKAGIIAALLSLGALKPAIAILSRFPWMVDVQPEIADLIVRVVKLSISDIYNSIKDTYEHNLDFTRPRSRYGATGVTPPPSLKPSLCLWAPNPPSTSTVEYIFFFPDWTEQVPICSSLDDVVDVVEPLMRFAGIHLSRDPSFLTKLMRLGRQHLLSTVPLDSTTNKPIEEPDSEDLVRQFWYRVVRQYILPSLPSIHGNAVYIVEIWNIIRQFDINMRWKLYGEWRSETYTSHPELRIRYVQADRESKGILRRLSHKTIDSLSGPLAKLTHSNPCILFTNAVNQIMAYDNLAAVVVQALKNITNLGFDVLIFVILDAMANPNKERVKDDGVNTSDWLLNLAAFTGMLFRRYSANITPILTYIVHQLQNGQTTEIVVLRELIWKLADIEPLPSLSDSQIQAMAGGPVLRIEAIASATRGARMDPTDSTRGSLQRLGTTLIETSLALPLLIQVAQQRQSAVFLARDAYLKSLAGLFDTTHGVLLQYLELLTTPSVVSPEDYANKVLPPLRDLHEKYGISAPICMQIVRPVLHAQLLESALQMQEQERKANEEAEKRLKAALTAKREPSTTQSRVASPLPSSMAETKPPAEVPPSGSEDVSMDPDPNASVPTAPESPWLPQLEAIFEDVRRLIPGQAYDILGPGFYVTFWQLSTYDLSPPTARYDEELSTLRSLSHQEGRAFSLCDKSADRSKRILAPVHRMKRERYNSFTEILTQEYKEHSIARAFTRKRLAREKTHWLTTVTNADQKQMQAHLLLDTFLEHCIHPRSLLSPMDADFCAQFIKTLHTLGTPGFHTLACYDKILGDQIKVILFSCSEYEARNYGRFLLGILSDLHKWHSDEQTYISDNRSKAGGKTALHTGFQTQYRLPLTAETQVKWPMFQRIVRKWHKKIATAFVECIQTGEFMHVYNAIIVLKEILPFFPLAAVAQDTGSQLDKTMDHFLEKEDRGDLKILGRAYSASLKKREQHWTPTKVGSKPAAAPSPRPTGPMADRPRSAAPPAGPSAQNAQSITNADIKRPSSQINAAAPSAPRAQLANSKPHLALEKSNIAAAMESVPRPPVVKRVRPEPSNTGSPKPTSDQPLEKDAGHSTDANDSNGRGEFKDQIGPKETPQPARGERPTQEQAILTAPTMLPPSEPSQKPSANELRATAHQSRSDKVEEKTSRQNGSTTHSPRRRSMSPSSRPGTRNHSSDSRASAGRSRGAGESSSDKRDREPIRRDSLTHTRRERTTTGDSDRDRDSRRDRHGDKERERGGERERDRDKDREREKDRDRHGDRHRRDDKREGARKDREGRSHNAESNSSAAMEERGSRPDTRHRNPQPDEALGKRRRGEEEVERGSKRSTRKDAHREDRDGRSRRPGEKNDHNDRSRESDRRNRREADGNENRAEGSDKAESKRPPDGPQGEKRPSDSQARGGTKPSKLTPSAPRAMSISENPRTTAKADAGRNQSVPSTPTEGGSGSLRSRISDKEPASRVASYPSRKDERDSRKRPFPDREKDAVETSSPGTDQASNKRQRLIRNRYAGDSANIAKKTLPISPQAGDRLQGRKD